MKILIFFIVIFIIPMQAFPQDSKTMEEIWFMDGNVVSCEPNILREGQSLVISLGENHGKELAIIRNSDKRAYFLVVGLPPKEMKGLMTPAEFGKAKSATIDENTIGFPWEANSTNEPIFVKPGSYAILVSDILESEIGGYKCTINICLRNKEIIT